MADSPCSPPKGRTHTRRRKNAVDETLSIGGRHRRETAPAEGRDETGHKVSPCSVCVQDIRAGTTATQIEVAPRQFGTVEHVDLRPAARKGAPALAFVEFKTEADAARCLRRSHRSRPSSTRSTVSVNGQLLKIERPRMSTGLAGTGTHRNRNRIEDSLSTAQEFLANLEADVTADVEASIATAGGCMDLDGVEATVNGRLTSTLVAWLRGKPNRFTLQKNESGKWVVKERVGTHILLL